MSSFYYSEEIKRPPALSVQDELQLFAEYAKKKTKLRLNRIVSQYLYWAMEIAYRYCKGRLEPDDAIGAANLGLMRAIQTFDVRKKKRFTTHSFFAIREEVILALHQTPIVDPYPGKMILRYKYRKTDQTPNDLQEYKDEWDKLFFSALCSFSLNKSGAKGIGAGRLEHLDELEDPEAIPELILSDERDSVENTDFLEVLRSTLPQLPRLQQKIVHLRYFHPKAPFTFERIGQILKITPQYVGQLHSAALAALKSKLTEKH